MNKDIQKLIDDFTVEHEDTGSCSSFLERLTYNLLYFIECDIELSQEQIEAYKLLYQIYKDAE